MTEDAQVAYMAQELALSDEPNPLDKQEEKKVAGHVILNEVKEALELAGFDAKKAESKDGDSTEVSFRYRGKTFAITLTHRAPCFLVGIRGYFEGDQKWEQAPLVYDHSTRTFVGTMKDEDITVAPGTYRPRASALKVLTEAVLSIAEKYAPQG